MPERMRMDSFLKSATFYGLLNNKLYPTKCQGLTGIFIALYQKAFRKIAQIFAILF